MKIMKDNNDLYLKVNALLLAHVLETFRKISINLFKLESLCYISTSGYRWDAMKKFNCTRLKLISDIEKYQFIESMIRGSASMIYKGHAEANNKFLKS